MQRYLTFKNTFLVFLLTFSLFFIYDNIVFAYDTCRIDSCYEGYEDTCVTDNTYYSDRYLYCEGTQVFWEYRQYPITGEWYRTDSSGGGSCSTTDHISSYLESCNGCCSTGGGPVPSTFSVAISPSLNTVYPGYSASHTVTVTPDNYTGIVNLDMAGTCPANATCTFSPTSATFVSTDTTAITSNLTITTNPSIAIQNYTITARGIDTAPEPDLTEFVSASLEVIAKPPNQAICDGAWHQMPGGGNTPSQPVGIQLGSVYSDKIGFVIRGTDNQTYYRTCDFSGSECYLNNNWTGIGGSPYYSPRTFFGADWDFNNKYSDKTYWSKFLHSIPMNTWSNWTYVGTGDEPWGTPYRFTDKIGRTWQLQRKADTTIEYACGTNLPCITPAFDASKSSISPTTVNINDNVTIRCDMSVKDMNGVTPFFTGGQYISYDGYDVTTAKFTFKATQPGTHIVSCNTSVTGQNFCASSNAIGTLTVGSALQPNLNISASSITGALTAGTALTFNGTVRNQGAAVSLASQTRLRIDIDNNGTWDVNPTNQNTGALAISGTENEIWSSAWTATTGTHKYEICADVTGTNTESNEGDNCITQTFTINPAVNNSPTANAGPDKAITLPTTTSAPTGTSATDSDGTISSTVWSFVSGPGPTPTITSGSTLTPSFSNMTSAGTYVFRLTATDNLGATGSDTMQVVVSPSGPRTTTTCNIADFIWCANEGGLCSFSGTKDVRYGASGQYYYLMSTNSVSCTNGVFGDPISGTAKSCYVCSPAVTTPDLTASASTPTIATVNVAQTFSSTISNTGNASTGASFSNFFQVATAANGGGTVTDLTATTMSALVASGSGTASVSRTFTTAGTYSVRACADKSSSANLGTIAESNENNNCGGWTNVTVSPASTCIAAGTGTGLTGKYYNGVNFDSLITTRTDSAINFDPADSLGSYANSSNGDTFSIRWEGQVQPRCTENYTFYTRTDDGARLWVNGNQVVNQWVPQAPTEVASSPITLTAGTKYDIKMEYYEDGGGAAAQLSWSSPSTAKAIIPQAQLYPLAPPVSATADIKANGSDNPPPITYNTSANLSWTYSGATSCTITSPASISVYPSGSGSVSTGNLVASRTYTISCQPGPVADTVTVNVPALALNLCVTKSGQGTVARNPSGTASNPDCWSYNQGDTVVLTATPAVNRIFTGWGGACLGTNKSSPCSVLMDSAKTVIVNFMVDPNYREF